MPRLPSAQDVPKVSPRVTSDPGVKVPVQAFESPLGIAAQELAPGIEKYAQVARQQENRRDTIDRSDHIDKKEDENDEKLRELNAKKDLSKSDVMAEYGAFLSQRRQERLNLHKDSGASNDSLTLLEVRLREKDDEATGKAAGISAQIGKDKIKTRHKNIITPLAIRAAQNPTLKNIDSILTEYEDKFNDIRAAADPLEEEALYSAGQEHIAMAVLESHLARNRVETAESLLIDGNLARFLSEASQRSVMRSIETIRFNRDEKKKELSEREKRILQLRERGFSEEFAQDVAAKDVSVTGPDKFGDFFVVNAVTGTKRKVEGQDKKAILDIVPPETEVPPVEGKDVTDLPEKRSIEENIKKGTGPFSKIQAGISNVFGPVIEGAIFKDTTDARQQVRIFSQIAKVGLINNPKFPVAEQQIVAGLLPNPDDFLRDPDTSASNLRELKGFLTTSKEAKVKESKKERISAERRADLSDQVSTIDELLSLMEKPKSEKKAKRQNLSTQEQVDALPKGTKFIWEPTGESFEKE